MAAYATRRTEKQKKVESINKEEYRGLNSEQFETLARIFLKDSIISSVSEKNHTIDNQRLNQFFESLPTHILVFKTDIHRRLIYNYITSNLQYGFNVYIDENLADEIFESIRRLAEIDPRLSK